MPNKPYAGFKWGNTCAGSTESGKIISYMVGKKKTTHKARWQKYKGRGNMKPSAIQRL